MIGTRRLLGSAVLLIALGAGSPAAAAEITVFAAASLADAVSEIGKAFAAASGHHVAFNFGASSDLGRQIRAGAPADVFFSADKAQMDGVEQDHAHRGGGQDEGQREERVEHRTPGASAAGEQRGRGHAEGKDDRRPQRGHAQGEEDDRPLLPRRHYRWARTMNPYFS